jgi:serine/threonine-protein kinase RsbW
MSKNKVEMRIPSDLVFERVVRAAAEEIGKQLDLSAEKVADLTLAVSEAVTNAIEHGNRLQREINVGVVFSMESDRLEISVIDQGEKSQPPEIRRCAISEDSIEEGELRGLGLYLIHQLVDQVEFTSNEEGNTFTMWLHIPPQNGQATRRQDQ